MMISKNFQDIRGEEIGKLDSSIIIINREEKGEKAAEF